VKNIIAYRDLPAFAGADLGVSSWHLVDQEHIDRFADAVGDRQWIHVDVERATREMGAPIAHGFLILSMLSAMSAESLDFTGVSRRINYGFDKLRFTGTVKAGSRVRLAHRMTKVEEKAGGLALTRECRIEIENTPQAALICNWIVLVLP
jgi:acyl dehydratase